MCEIWSKLIIKIPERRQWRRSGVFIVNFEQISNSVLEFSSLTLNKQMLAYIKGSLWFSVYLYFIIGNEFFQ